MTVSDSFEVRPLRPDELPALRDLRYRVLRPGRPRASAVFPGDTLSSTVHLGAFDPDGQLAGIATLLNSDGIQLRGMATSPEVRGQGAGAAILRAAHAIAAERHLTLWCNARLSAVGFYEKLGWRTEGDEFDVPDVGPHYIMRWMGESEFALASPRASSRKG